jgi:serine phosphatase RsbU (regulator of sigma subunit)
VPLAVFSNEYLEARDGGFINQTEGIPEGSKLLLYTDGLIETTRTGQREPMFEYNGLRHALRDLQPRSAEDFVGGIYRHLVEYRGDETFEDDICIICAEI